MTPTPLPFSHGNQSLAIALHAAGFPIREMWREYSLADERKLGLNAAELTAKGIGGRFRFFHDHAKGIEEIVKAYDAESARIKKAIDGDEGSLSDIPCATPELIASIASHILYVRRRVNEELRNPHNSRVVESNGEPVNETSADGSRIVTHPGLRICSGTASAETRRKLNL